MTCGVYKLTFPDSDNFYIGSSVNIEKRFQTHLNELEKGKHNNSRIANCYAKYGNPVCVILHSNCPIGYQRVLEQIYLNLYFDNRRQCLNLCKDSRFPEMTHERRDVLSEKALENWQDSEYLENHAKALLDPEYSVKCSKRTKQLWDNPLIRDKYVKAITEYSNKLETKQSRSEMMTEVWKNPDRVKRQRETHGKLTWWFHLDYGFRHCCQAQLLNEFPELSSSMLSSLHSSKKFYHRGWIHLTEVISETEAKSLCLKLSGKKSIARSITVIINEEILVFDSIMKASVSLKICRRKLREIINNQVTKYKHIEFLYN